MNRQELFVICYQIKSEKVGLQSLVGLSCDAVITKTLVFLYLSDVEEGGGTRFNSQKITVQPKQGRAVIWPSVLDEDPNKKDSRTGHEALPVIKGVKYAANAWVHQVQKITKASARPSKSFCFTLPHPPLLSFLLFLGCAERLQETI